MANIKQRVLEEANTILDTGYTIRRIAKIYNISKSTVHKDLTDRLYKIDAGMHKRVIKVLDYHTAIRHIRGGASTKEKYLKLKK